MPRYYCDYCDTYLTHDSPSVRKQHNSGYKHKANVRTYYQQFEQQQTQSLIDQRIKEHLSGQAAFGISVPFGAWRPGMPMRPPILPAPLPIPGQMLPNAPMAPIPRLAVMPRPMAAPVYGNAPVPAQPGAPGAPMHAPNPAQPGVPAGAPMQQNGLPGPPPMSNPTSAPGSTVPGSNGAPPGLPQPVFQNPGTSGNFSGTSMPALPSFPSSGGNAPYPATSGTDSFSYARPPN